MGTVWFRTRGRGAPRTSTTPGSAADQELKQLLTDRGVGDRALVVITPITARSPERATSCTDGPVPEMLHVPLVLRVPAFRDGGSRRPFRWSTFPTLLRLAVALPEAGRGRPEQPRSATPGSAAAHTLFGGRPHQHRRHHARGAAGPQAPLQPVDEATELYDLDRRLGGSTCRKTGPR
jgi:hypothetical protein